MMSPTIKSNYSSAWKRLNFYESALHLTSVGLAVVFLLIGCWTFDFSSYIFAALFYASEWVSHLLGFNSMPLQIIIGVALLFAPVVALTVLRNNFKCPRCQQKFFYRASQRTDGEHCPHCGLRRP